MFVEFGQCLDAIVKESASIVEDYQNGVGIAGLKKTFYVGLHG